MSVGFQVLLLKIFRVKLKLEMCPDHSELQEVLSKASFEEVAWYSSHSVPHQLTSPQSRFFAIPLHECCCFVIYIEVMGLYVMVFIQATRSMLIGFFTAPTIPTAS